MLSVDRKSVYCFSICLWTHFMIGISYLITFSIFPTFEVFPPILNLYFTNSKLCLVQLTTLTRYSCLHPPHWTIRHTVHWTDWTQPKLFLSFTFIFTFCILFYRCWSIKSFTTQDLNFQCFLKSTIGDFCPDIWYGGGEASNSETE